jgi:transglutaminase-like putative cysteine protease
VLRLLSRNFAFAVYFVLILSGSALAGGVNIPDWMRHAAAKPVGTYPPDTKAVVLLDQTDYTVIGPGNYVEHSRWVVKILRSEGRGEGDLSVDLGQKEKLNYIHVWTIDRSAHEYELKQRDFVEKSFPSFELYDDIKFLTAKAPAADPGSVIAFEYEARRRSYVNQINQFFQESNPALEVHISMTLPTGWEFKDSWPVSAALKPAQTAPDRWEWVAHDLPGIEDEPMMPRRHVLMGRLAIAYFPPGETGNMGSWAALGRWYNMLTAGRRDPTPEITEQVQRLLAGKPDFDSKLRVLTAFLQSDIRYVAIEIGIGGYQPHSASEVYRYHYGDCKDKATLLSSMLHVAGINSDYVIIDTDRGFVNPAVPSIWFNHAILAIELPPDIKGDQYHSVITIDNRKRYIIFDPTDEYTPVGSLRSELQDSYALLVTDSGGQLVRTPLLQPDSNSINRTGHFVLSADGALAGDVSEDRGGDFAMRERGHLHNWDERERTNYFERWLGRSLHGFTLLSMDVLQTDQLQKDVLIKYKFSTPQYGQQRGPLMLVRPRVLGEESSPVEHKPRHYSVEMEQTAKETDVYEIEIPPGYTVDDVPDPVKIDVGFASYQSKIEVEGSKLRYWREYLVRDLSVPPEKFQDWVKLQGAIGADETAAVVLKRAP